MISLIGESATGLYQAGFRLALPLMMFVTMFEFAWRPFFLQQASAENARELFSRVFTYFNVVAGSIFLIVAFFVASLAAVPIPFTEQTLIGRRFWEGLTIVPLILAGYIFVGWYTNFIVGVYVEKRTASLPLITGAGALTKAALCFVLIPVVGLFGGAWATLIAYVAMAAILYVFVQRFYPIRYEWGRVARVLAGVAVLYAASEALVDFMDASLRANAIRVALLAVYPVWLWLTGFFDRAELAQLRRIKAALRRG
jgi:O-antigen/teichoic acid export membrane protein